MKLTKWMMLAVLLLSSGWSRAQQSSKEVLDLIVKVNDYWQEWHEPRVVMEQNLMDEHGNVSPFDLYRHPAIGKTFHVQGISYNLTSGTAQMTIKEIF